LSNSEAFHLYDQQKCAFRGFKPSVTRSAPVFLRRKHSGYAEAITVTGQIMGHSLARVCLDSHGFLKKKSHRKQNQDGRRHETPNIKTFSLQSLGFALCGQQAGYARRAVLKIQCANESKVNGAWLSRAAQAKARLARHPRASARRSARHAEGPLSDFRESENFLQPRKGARAREGERIEALVLQEVPCSASPGASKIRTANQGRWRASTLSARAPADARRQ